MTETPVTSACFSFQGEVAVVREVSESLGANQAVGSSGAGINNETPATLSSDCALDLRAHVFTRLVGADVKGKAEVLGSTMVLVGGLCVCR